MTSERISKGQHRILYKVDVRDLNKSRILKFYCGTEIKKAVIGGHVAERGGTWNACRILVMKPLEKYHLEDSDEGGG
jgi:hypothetical protein